MYTLDYRIEVMEINSKPRLDSSSGIGHIFERFLPTIILQGVAIWPLQPRLLQLDVTLC